MARSKQAKSAIPYIERLLEDEYVQEQLRNAASGLRLAYKRARSQRAQAAEDKRLYGNLRHAATSIRKAVTALQRPKPQPKHRIRKIASAALAAGGGALLILTLRRSQSKSESGSSASYQGPVAVATPDGTTQTSEPKPATAKTST
jgi:ferric-dicitrate binding protein FerR (iron transport regulator)